MRRRLAGAVVMVSTLLMVLASCGPQRRGRRGDATSSSGGETHSSSRRNVDEPDAAPSGGVATLEVEWTWLGGYFGSGSEQHGLTGSGPEPDDGGKWKMTFADGENSVQVKVFGLDSVEPGTYTYEALSSRERLTKDPDFTVMAYQSGTLFFFSRCEDAAPDATLDLALVGERLVGTLAVAVCDGFGSSARISAELQGPASP